jgi:hypothetical protein
MHPTIHEYLAKARIADLHRQAQRTSAATACAGSRPLRPAGSSPR